MVGHFSLGETNKRGLLLLKIHSKPQVNFKQCSSSSQKVEMGDLAFPGRSIHNQIDIILLLRHFKSSINK